MKTDIEIARSIPLRPIGEIAAQVGIPQDSLEYHGKYIAKVDLSQLPTPPLRGKLILVTAITATKAGIGKTTVSIGLALGMSKLGKKAVVNPLSALALASRGEQRAVAMPKFFLWRRSISTSLGTSMRSPLRTT